MKKKKIFVGLIAVAILFSLAACKTNQPNPTPPSPPVGITTYTVTFENNGHGSTLEKFTGVSKLTILPVLTENGWKLDGWYYDLEFTKKAEEGQIIEQDTILYAKWTPADRLTVYFNANGGSTVLEIEDIISGSIINKPKDPVKEGYTFLGWYKDDNGELKEAFDFEKETITKCLTLYAKWEAQTYTITFISNGGTAINHQIVAFRECATRPVSPEKKGYVFAGWYKDEELQHEFDFVNTMIVKDHCLYARWEEESSEENTFIVYFNSKDGSYVPNLYNVLSGSKIKKPSDPVRIGYTFLGWYKDTHGTLTEKFNFEEDTITANTTLYARWERNKYTLSFVSNGGTQVEEQMVNAMDYAVRPVSPKRDGYIFIGWYSDAELKHEFDFVNTTILKDYTLYAKWELGSESEDRFKVYFNSKGGSAVPTLENIAYGSKIEKPEDPVRDGYTFLGWYKDEQGALVDRFDFTKDTITEDITLFAKWTETPLPTFIVTFEANGGSVIPAKEIQEGQTISSPNPPIREGYIFEGWYIDALCTRSYVFSTSITSNITLYAKWEKLPVEENKEIVFDFTKFNSLTQGKLDENNKTTTDIPMGQFMVAAGSKATNTELNTQGKIVTFTLNGSKNNGFIIIGKGGSGNKTAPGTTNISLYKFVNGSLVLLKELGSVVYDKFITIEEENLEAGTYQLRTDKSLKISKFNLIERSIETILEEFTVSFVFQNGMPEKIEIVQEGMLIAKPEDPTKEGYVFKGWFTSNSYMTEFDFSIPIVADLVLYAKWDEEPIDPNAITYIVHFVTDCLIVIEDKIVVEGKLLGKPTPPVREEYRFGGWFLDYDFKQEYLFDTPVMSNLTLYAKWEEIITYTIHFEMNGYGEPIESITRLEYIPELPKPSSSQKSFGGWYYDKELSSKAFTGDILDSTITLYAKWNDKSNVKILRAEGNLETAYAEWKAVPEANSYNVYYKKSTEPEEKYVALDKMLIREYSDKFRADVLGLAAGNYTIKVVAVFGMDESEHGAEEDVTVLAHTRSGFAFAEDSPFKTASGAYNDDGTLRLGAQVIYVTAKNAKTVKATVQGQEYAGFQNIIYAKQKAGSTDILDFRIVGEIKRDDLDDYLSKEEGIQIKGAKAYQNMNITIEGVGEDATFNGFGFLIRNCGNVEMRNFGIVNFMDDGISIDTNNCNLWIHNVDFFYGSPGGDSDQAKGDGSLDIKKHSRYITASYNHFWDSGKCNLQGMKSEATEDYITYHHNWYDHSDSRHPRIRTCSVHVYNNYFDGNSKYGVGITMGGSAFVENNFFRNCHNPMLSSNQGTDALGDGTFSGETGGIIKAFGNHIEGGNSIIWYSQNALSFDAYLASSRDEKLPSAIKTLAGGTSYNNFDTSSTFYIYEVDSAEVAKDKVMKYAGRINGGDLQFVFDNEKEDSNYDVIPELKQMVLNYKTKLIRILGES